MYIVLHRYCDSRCGALFSNCCWSIFRHCSSLQVDIHYIVTIIISRAASVNAHAHISHATLVCKQTPVVALNKRGIVQPL